jgi:formate hydrogenlyase subunit 3/multisubunit Na+/H+ antiporter MnhD subunit
LAIALSVLLCFWPLLCLFFFVFGHCFVCSSLFLAIALSWPKTKKNRQSNGQKQRRTDKVMAKNKEEQTKQWPKTKKNRQSKQKRSMLFILFLIALNVP